MVRELVSGGRVLCVMALVVLARTTPVSASGIRLDRDVVPELQAIDLTIDPARPDFQGTTSIEINVTRPVTALFLNAEELAIDQASLRGKRGEVALEHMALDDGVLRLTTGKSIEAGRYTLHMAFHAAFSTQADALYRLDIDGASYAFSQFEAVEARRAIPCWDEPSFKIPYQVSLTVPSTDIALSNAPIESETPNGAMKRVVFARTKPLPSYLLALAVGPLDEVPVPGLSIPGNVYVTHGRGRLLELAAQVTPGIVAALEAYFGTPYPFEKLDQVAVPEFWAGAMENAGLITYRDEILLLDPDQATEDDRRHLIEVMTHEIAHQWFGNLVTMSWWDDLWLNEAFADWICTKTCQRLYPEDGFDVASVAAGYRAMETDAHASTRAIRRPVTTLENLLESADILVYEKGERVLGMFERWMGPDLFQSAVRRYLGAHAWGNATAQDLWDVLSEASGRDVAAAMATFLDQPGVPLVTVSDLGAGKLRLSQERFLTHAGDGQEPSELWQIPMRLRYADADSVRTQRVWLSTRDETVQLRTTKPLLWIHPNADDGGYYLWTVPPKLRETLAAQAASVMGESERVGFAALLEALLRAGKLTGGEYLAALESEARDSSPRVLDGVVREMTDVHDTFVTPDLNEAFGGYVTRLLVPLLDRYGLEPVAGEEEEVTLLRPGLLRSLGKYGRYEPVRRFARQRCQDYLKDPASVHSSLVSTVVSLAAMDGDAALFDEYVRRFAEADVPMVRKVFLAGLGGFEDLSLATRALDQSIRPDVRPQEVFTIPEALADTEERRDVAWAWLRRNYDAVVAKIPPPYVIYLVWAGGGCSDERAASAKAFFTEPGRDVPGLTAQLDEMLEFVEDCTDLRKREGASVAAYVRGMAGVREGSKDARLSGSSAR